MRRWLIGAFIAWAVGYGMGFLVKSHVVFEDGYQFCTYELNKILLEGIEYGRDFWITGIEVKFVPRKDGTAVNIQRKES